MDESGSKIKGDWDVIFFYVSAGVRVVNLKLYPILFSYFFKSLQVLCKRNRFSIVVQSKASSQTCFFFVILLNM